jgi:collagenase-like PrtC family protease
MEYTVACNWDPELIDRIDYPEVKSLFGAIPNAVISGGRPSHAIKNLTEAEIKSFIKRVHDKGWKFDYNINSTCLGNRETTLDGFKEIIKYVEWIVGLGADAVTIGNTNLINIVRKNFPNLKINVSTFLKVNNLPQAQRFEDLGVSAIMLSEHINRSFKLLKEIRSHVKCKLILIANVGCIYNCPNLFSHSVNISHNATTGGIQNVFTDSYNSYCFQKRLEDPVELVKIRWIRPEDVTYYEDIGIDVLKILERFTSTNILAERVKAFHERKYKGNILEMLGQMAQRNDGDMSSSIMKDLNEEQRTKIFKYLGVFSSVLSDLYYLDNSKLPPNFIDGFANRDCDRLSCNACGYCRKIAQEAVNVIDKEKIATILQNIHEVRNQIMDGTLLF